MKKSWDQLPPGKAKQAFVKWALSKQIPLETAKLIATRKFGGSSKSRMIDDYQSNKDSRFL